MKVLNFGSLNVDNVYSVDHMVIGGETINSCRLEQFCGGKGLNQSIALAQAGADVYHAGAIGTDGQMLLDVCGEYGVNTDYIKKMDQKGGHTIIQVDASGQNSIILYGGTNRMISKEFVDHVLSHFDRGDYLVLQNEINMLPYIIEEASVKGMKIVLNPSPYDSELDKCDLSKVSLFILNEIEGFQLTGFEEPDKILDAMHKKFPNAEIVLTLGSKGSLYDNGTSRYFQDIFKVNAVDTTAAGDTFTGFYLGSIINGKTPQEALRIASRASSIAVTRKGAVPSIPKLSEVMAGLND